MTRLPGPTEIDVVRPGHQSLGHYSGGSRSPRPPVEIDADGPFQIMWRRRWGVLIMVLMCVAGGVAYLKYATPMYPGQGRLQVTGEIPPVLSGGNDSRTNPAINLVAKESATIKSGPVVSKALAMLPVDKMKSFAEVRDPNRYVLSNLIVIPGRQDATFELMIELPDPKEAADVVNAIGDAYKQDREESNTASKVITVLRSEKEKREKDYAEKSEQLENFRKQHGYITLATEERGNSIITTLEKLEAAYTDSLIKYDEASVNLQQSNHRANAIAEFRRAEALMKRAKSLLDEQNKKAFELAGHRATALRLKTEEDRAKLLLDKVEERLAAVEANQNSITWDIRWLEQAQPATKPSKPDPKIIIPVTIVLGLLLGFGVAWIRERTDHRLTNVEEISAILGLPVLSVIPSMPGRGGAVARGQRVHLESMSDVAEAFRTLRTVVYFSVPENKSKTILLTSPNQGEGKSTTASGLAIAMAKAGRRTLIIDADLRKPTLHRIFELGDKPGVSSVMAGKESLENAIHHTAVEGLDVLPCGPIPLNPSEILNSKAFAEMLVKLGTRYDHIIIDSPPVLPVTDARILGATCDVTLLVLRANRSTRRMSEYAADAMLGVGARVLGLVVNDVPRNRRGGYYGTYGYGYGQRAYGRNSFAAPVTGNGGQKHLPHPESSAA